MDVHQIAHHIAITGVHLIVSDTHGEHVRWLVLASRVVQCRILNNQCSPVGGRVNNNSVSMHIAIQY